MILEKPILLIDTSYISFYRFHATVFWYKKANKDTKTDDKYEWFKDSKFMDKFTSMYLRGIEKVLKKHKLEIPYENFVFGLDTPIKEIWRIKFYPQYKQQRDYTGWTGSPVLKYAHTELIDKLCKTHNMTNIKIDQLEADDVLAITKQYIRAKLPNQQIIIITNDHDYFQLIDPVTTIINLQCKILNEKSCGDPQKDLLIKILCGDSSDNITGCFKRCGIKTATKYSNNKTLLEAAFEKEPTSKAIYDRNRKLIDFNYIPEELKKKTLEKVVKITEM